MVMTDWEPKEKIQEWARVAENDRLRYFSEAWSVIRKEREAFFKSFVRIQRGNSVLDVGCGSGKDSLLALEQGARVSALDQSREMIQVAHEWAQAQGYDLEAKEGDAHCLKFPDASFDIVLCFYVFYHLRAPGKALSEIRRVLKPGGRVYLTAPNALHFLGALSLWFMQFLGCSPRGHIPFFTYAKMKRMLAEAGFKITKFSGRLFMPPLSGLYTSDLKRRTFLPAWMIQILDSFYLWTEAHLRMIFPFKYFCFHLVFEAEKWESSSK